MEAIQTRIPLLSLNGKAMNSNSLHLIFIGMVLQIVNIMTTRGGSIEIRAGDGLRMDPLASQGPGDGTIRSIMHNVHFILFNAGRPDFWGHMIKRV
jgi:hypothetical protein